MSVRPLSLWPLLLAAPLAAQGFEWKIPERGAAMFARQTERLVVRPKGVERRKGIRRPIRSEREGGHVWRYREFDAGLGKDGWQRPEFDDKEWSIGPAAFGNQSGRTRWTKRFLHARAQFDTGRRAPRTVVLSVSQDDIAKIWLNGTEVYARDKVGSYHHVLDTMAMESLVVGVNLLAVQCENPTGAGRLDVAVTLLEKAIATPKEAVNVALAGTRTAEAIRRELFVPWRAPAILCQGQLDEEHRAIRLTPVDVRDFGSFTALDLTRAGLARAHTVVLPRTGKLGDVQIKGRFKPVDATGHQRATLAVESRMPDARGDNGRYLERHVTPNYKYELDGQLEIRRHLDPDNGLVRGFTTALTADIASRASESAGTYEVVLEETWSLKEVRQNRDSRFEQAVHEAIQKAAQKIKDEIKNPGTKDLKNEPKGDRSYNSGRLALALLAMVHGGIARDDPVLVKGFAELRKRRIIDTYSLAHAIMATEALYRPAGEHEELRAGLIQAPRKRQPSPEDREHLERWTTQLLQNVDTRVDRGYLVRFNYVRGRRYDHSVNQYGLLGLYSAHLCGIDIPSTVWEGAASHLIDDQQKPKEKVKLELTSYKQWQESRVPGRTTTREGKKTARAAGWGYGGPKSNGVENPIYGSMTCAGITGLTICQAGLRDLGVKRSELTTRADAAIRAGFAWLDRHMSLHWHPGRISHLYSHFFYYLYGLERACELSGVSLINDRDWYFEGALALLDQQAKDGSWPRDARGGAVVERTAFALLFLKKASAPVYTQHR